MNQVKAILESLKDLNMDKATQLFNNATATRYSFYHAKNPNDSAMFIFPDGKILASVNSDENQTYVGDDGETHLGRLDNHQDLYEYMPEYDEFIDENIDIDTELDFLGVDVHPVNNTYLAKVYNLVLVAAHHKSNWILIPKGVEPTAEQQDTISKFVALGYRVKTGYDY